MSVRGDHGRLWINMAIPGTGPTGQRWPTSALLRPSLICRLLPAPRQSTLPSCGRSTGGFDQVTAIEALLNGRAAVGRCASIDRPALLSVRARQSAPPPGVIPPLRRAGCPRCYDCGIAGIVVAMNDTQHPNNFPPLTIERRSARGQRRDRKGALSGNRMFVACARSRYHSPAGIGGRSLVWRCRIPVRSIT